MEEPDVQEEESFDLPEVADEEDDATDYKAEALKLRDKAIAQRERTKSLKKELSDARKAVEVVASSKKEPSPVPTNELDETSLLWLEVKGMKTDDLDEMKIIEDWKKDSGKDVRAIWASKAFQSELKSLRDEKAVQAAIPSGTKRGASQGGDIASATAKFEETGVLPEDFELASAVVNAVTKAGNDRLPPWQR